MAIRRINYRIKQFYSIITGSFRPVDIKYVKEKLPSAELLALFMRMPRTEQNHAIAVSKGLEQQGLHASDLQTAALLHDAGKIQHFPRIWERIIAVLFMHYTPHLAAKMARGAPRGIGRGVAIHQHHAAWGADMVRRAGASSRVIFLVETHHSVPGDDLELAALQAVDDG